MSTGYHRASNHCLSQGIFASTGWPTPKLTELNASSLPLAQKLALISEHGDILTQSEASIEDDKTPGLKADRIGQAELLSQMQPKGSLRQVVKRPGPRRKQPKQGPSVGARASAPAASAAQMASAIRRQLLDLCREAKVPTGPLQVEEAPRSPKPLKSRQWKPTLHFEQRPRPALATQLRRATLDRAQREREIQKRSRAVQTMLETTTPEICVKISPEPVLIPKSVQLEGYHWQTAARFPEEGPDKEPTCPAGLFQQGAPVCNTFEDQIVVGETHADAEDAFMDRLEQLGGSPSYSSWRSPETAALARQFEGPPHSFQGFKVPWRELDAETWEDMGDGQVNSQVNSQSTSRSQAAEAEPLWAPLRSRSARAGATTAESYDLTVFEAMCRNFGMGPEGPDVSVLDSEAKSESGKLDPPEMHGSSRPSSIASLQKMEVTGPGPGPDEPYVNSDESDLDRDPLPMEKPSDPTDGPVVFRSAEGSIASQSDEGSDFLRAATPVEPALDSSESGASTGRSQEIPVLPPYRPLPPLQADRPGGLGDVQARLAPKQLEEQFYSSLQILDSVHEHLAQVDLLSQQRTLHRQYTAQYDARPHLQVVNRPVKLPFDGQAGNYCICSEAAVFLQWYSLMSTLQTVFLATAVCGKSFSRQLKQLQGKIEPAGKTRRARSPNLTAGGAATWPGFAHFFGARHPKPQVISK